MSVQPERAQLTGLDDSHLVNVAGGHRLQLPAADAFLALREDAAAAGFDLVIASSFRSFERQLVIWNGKACGERPVYNDNDEPVMLADMAPADRLHAILRYSAIPGTSRHHWGTDLDIYDARAVPEGYRLQLSTAEVSAGGPFDALHCWLDERMAAQASHGFYRPYSEDRGGVAPERWHLSYAPLSREWERGINAEVLMACWNAISDELQLRDEIEQILPDILQRYVEVPASWCGLRAGA
ncbi:MAG: M15 family metallopeptidase [Halieaceae bacterium]|nr:M15 family metallopeptidase [Halieaceae bacterium]MCP4467168.1 M15 family metallopeptidase [Halieaceae bacterium]MDG2411088.1 M15 family metallopeptidase [Halioglobus sp.]